MLYGRRIFKNHKRKYSTVPGFGGVGIPEINILPLYVPAKGFRFDISKL
jgi:hypothetical protein